MVNSVKTTKLRALRTEGLMTQTELAEKAGTCVLTVSRAERGERVSFRVVKAFASALGCEPSEITEG